AGLYQTKRSPAAGAGGHDASERRMTASSPLGPLTSTRPVAAPAVNGPTDSVLETTTVCCGVMRSASARSPVAGFVENDRYPDELPSPVVANRDAIDASRTAFGGVPAFSPHRFRPGPRLTAAAELSR